MHRANKHTITVEASTEHLTEVRNFAGEQAKAWGFTQDERADIRLAVDEAFTNIIEHAYEDNPHQYIDLEIEYSDEQIRVSLYDSGQSFCEKNYKKPNIKKRIKQKKRGGVGVHLIKKLMDEVDYIHRRDRNEIRMIKKRKHP